MSLEKQNVSERLENLIFCQEDLSSRIKKAEVNFKKSPRERVTKEYVESRLEILEQLWCEFLAGHKELIKVTPAKELTKCSYFKQDVYDITEEIYMDYKTYLKTQFAMFLPSLQVSNQNSNKKEIKNIVKLPKSNIPNFSGKYSEWTTFRDLFKSLIHTNVDLDNVQKLQYLKGFLVGEAERLLKHMPITDDNYDRCWTLLEERYNNKRFICHQILKRLLSQRNVETESANNLKELIDTTNDCLASLTNLGIMTSSWDVFIIYIITLKLDQESRRQWEFFVSDNVATDEFPTYNQFQEFLKNRYRAIEFLPTDSRFNNKKIVRHPIKVNTLHTFNYSCLFCAEEHKLGSCKKFCSESVTARRNFVKDKAVCFCCLGKNHSAKVCRVQTRCNICKRKHHTLLHPESDENREINMEKKTENQISNPIISCISTNQTKQHVLLATAVVNVLSKTGNLYGVRALLDQGSQSSFVTESTVQLLGLRKTSIDCKVLGVGGGAALSSKAMVTMEIRSRIEPQEVIEIKAYVLKSITTLLPSTNIESLQWYELKSMALADPQYHTSNRIDLLLGAEVYGKVIREGVKRGPLGTPTAQLTSFGWILSGVINPYSEPVNKVHVMHCHVDDNELLKKFWELESESIYPRQKMLTKNEIRCEEYFEKTTERDEDGRYIVRLPFNTENPEVRDSEKISVNRLKSLERKFYRDPVLKQRYIDVMNDYLSSNHMELIPSSINNNGAIYIPHHAVIRDDKITTKVRVVNDASCKGSNNKSLNDNLLVGPALQPDLRHLIMKWRAFPICLSADIIKMYRQVKVNIKDVDYQRIVWREDANKEIKHYRMLRVTFGTACAPYLAVKVLHQVALDEGQGYPLAFSRVLQDFYMDDLLTGCQSVEEGYNVYQQLKELLSKGGFYLQKWSSNSDKLMEKIIEEDRLNEGDSEKGLHFKTDAVLKILGLTWNRNSDCFQYTVTMPTLKEPLTKRMVISDIARLFDPLGWIAPTVIIAKVIIQKLWLAGIGWDEVVPKNILHEWKSYRENLKVLENVNISRWIGSNTENTSIQLHGFCDASKVAYAAVIYARITDANGDVTVNLIAAKTKVAPIKQVSIPRLELCGAVLLAKLFTEVGEVMNIKKENWYGWTDSSVVLAWINNHPNKYKTFVANRVSTILDHLEPQQWFHIQSKHNPADCASRGLRPSELIQSCLWFYGPKILKEKTIKPTKPRLVSTNLEETKGLCTTINIEIWSKYSSFTKLSRVIGYCRRFLNMLKPKNMRHVSHILTMEEINQAREICIRQNQREKFDEEIRALKLKNKIKGNSKILLLNPYLDEKDILRVGGRLEFSNLDTDRKHPIIIPKDGCLSKLLVDEAHKKTLHGGPQLMLSYLYSTYWIPGVKQLVKAHVHKCIICVKNAAKPLNQLMGQLPSYRITPERPFKKSGVDYAGPINIRATKGKGFRSYKGYICLFICMVTKAVHIEVVGDLTSKSFLAAFRRFVARRGHCTDIWSDNGTNFVGASNELKLLFDSEKSTIRTEIVNSLNTNGTAWHFIPPHAPHFGGLWEAAIKSAKYHLKRVIGETTLTFEELSTVMAQIEACLNSRPLSRIDSVSDFPILTPGHFLVGEALVTSPDYNYESYNMSSLRRWQLTQRMLQNFWRRWSNDYLNQLQQRYKWKDKNTEPKKGDVVLVKENDLPPCKWLLGVITEKHPGADNITRVVTIRTKGSLIKRPITKLCVLPVTE